VAFPALPFIKTIMIGSRHGKEPGVMYQVAMATQAILLYYMPAILPNENGLRFQPHGKHVCMPHPVLGFEIIFIENVVVGHMAIVAMCNFPVRTM
jgi:hypothetical protein